jgi:hypothetical protein
LAVGSAAVSSTVSAAADSAASEVESSAFCQGSFTPSRVFDPAGCTTTRVTVTPGNAGRGSTVEPDTDVRL